MSAVAAWVDANPGYAMVAALAIPFAILDAVVFGAFAVRWLKPRPVAAVVVATLAAIVLPVLAFSGPTQDLVPMRSTQTWMDNQPESAPAASGVAPGPAES